ncbi:MAG: cyclodeaminase/cyclohydrolase family protein [Clostridiales Family XIII bacterium]|jgi:formiminotetrahydrofolate cyclodeaminase|nr:cyclodeaminase/cyclohydrolase family protein [Clostridiales Family XIII bacterium]
MDFVKRSCEEFAGALASGDPVPGGGGASALAGALGVALGAMVASLTLGRKKYADVQDDVALLQARAARLQQGLLALVQADAEGFEPLARAYGLPRGSEAEEAERARVVEAALAGACAAPLSIMEKCCEAIELHRAFLEKGAVGAVSDVGVGVLLCGAALRGASLNVFINTKSMADRAGAGALERRAASLLESGVPAAEAVYAAVSARLKGETRDG